MPCGGPSIEAGPSSSRTDPEVLPRRSLSVPTRGSQRSRAYGGELEAVEPPRAWGGGVGREQGEVLLHDAHRARHAVLAAGDLAHFLGPRLDAWQARVQRGWTAVGKPMCVPDSRLVLAWHPYPAGQPAHPHTSTPFRSPIRAVATFVRGRTDQRIAELLRGDLAQGALAQQPKRPHPRAVLGLVTW